jgi:hypothetical protein
MKKLFKCLVTLSALWVNILYASEVNQAKLTAADGDSLAQFGCSVSISGDYAIVGAVGDDENGLYSGAAYIFMNSASTWEEQTKLIPNDAALNDRFGISVSISNNYAIVGAYNGKIDGINIGSAYIFKREGINWIEEDKLIPSDGAASDRFGHSLSISGDYVVVGSPQPFGNKSGSAYIFKRDGTNWIQQARLVSSDSDSFDNFGYSVSISGEYAIVGARNDDDNGPESGSAYIFKRDGTNWIQQAKLLANDGVEIDQFGFSVAIDGDYAVVGASQDDDNGFNSGSAYIFKRDESIWVEQDKLTASDGFPNMFFGSSVSMDGDYVVLGAYWALGSRVGSAYIFRRDSLLWVEETKLTASDGTADDGFGQSVSIAGDYTIVGAALDDDKGNDTGSAYLYSGIIVGIEKEISHIPTEFILYQNYPNPFNPTTVISYQLPYSSHVIIRVYNTMGHEVETLVNEDMPPGYYTIPWKGQDNYGNKVSSGIYFCRIHAGNYLRTKRMTILR